MIADRISEAAGRIARWLLLAMVLLGAFNALARYLGRAAGVQLSSNAFLEGQWYLFSLVFLLGGAYTLKHGEHVRVDVLYARFGSRVRTWIDLLGTLLFLVPFCLFGLVVAWPAVRNSWALAEGSPDPGGLPRYPIKAVLLVGFALLLLQGLAWAWSSVRRLRGGP